MSPAEVLRKAAEVARHGVDFGYAHGGDDAFVLALADWWEVTASRIDAGRDPKSGGRRNHGWRGTKQALAVARAYLRETP